MFKTGRHWACVLSGHMEKEVVHMAKALDVAAYIVRYCYDKKTPISNLQLQKILYFAWIDYFTETNKSLFEDPFRAWALGPVIVDVYNKYSIYGSMPIRPVDETSDFFGDSKDLFIINPIIDKYRRMSAFSLVDKSHVKDGAWDLVYNQGKNHGSNIIPYELIKEKRE